MGVIMNAVRATVTLRHSGKLQSGMFMAMWTPLFNSQSAAYAVSRGGNVSLACSRWAFYGNHLNNHCVLIRTSRQIPLPSPYPRLTPLPECPCARVEALQREIMILLLVRANGGLDMCSSSLCNQQDWRRGGRAEEGAGGRRRCHCDAVCQRLEQTAHSASRHFPPDSTSVSPQ